MNSGSTRSRAARRSAAQVNYRIGMAWTQPETIAGHIRDGKRRRLGLEALAFQAAAGEDAVLALFGDRREREAVIDPALITGARRVLRPTWDGDERQC